MNVAFGRPTIPVDTHVFRLSNRLGLTKTKGPLETERRLLDVMPEWVGAKAHHLLILHGRHVCKARKPLCGRCRVAVYCEYPSKTAGD